MMHAVFAAVGSMASHQNRVDAAGNNIANVNSEAFKNSSNTFEDVFEQVGAGTAATAAPGRSNPRRVGTGMQENGIDKSFTEGSVKPTGNPGKVMIQGNGFFVLSDGTDTYYTKGIDLGLDSEGNLMNKVNGMYLQNVDGGHITIDPDSQNFQIDGNGFVAFVDAGGAQHGAGDEGYQIALARFTNSHAQDRMPARDIQLNAQQLERYNSAAQTEVEAGGKSSGADAETSSVV